MNTVILIVALLGLLLGGLYTVFKPRWAILFIIVLYPLEQLMTTVSTFFAANSKLMNLFVGGLAIIAGFTALISGRAPFRGYFNTVFYLTLALYVWVYFGVIYAPDKSKAIEDVTLAIPYLGLLLVFPALLVNNLSDFRRLMLPTMIVGSAIVLMIMMSPNTTLFSGRLGIEGAQAGGSKIQNPLATATLGGMLVVIGMLYKPSSFAFVVNIIRAGAIGSGLAITMLSGSRGQMIAAVGSALLLFPFARHIKNIGQFIAVGGSAGIAVIFGMAVLQTVTTAGAAQRWDAAALESGVSNRWVFISRMLDEYLSRPFSYLPGLGTSSFPTYWYDDRIPYVHNMPAQVLTEHGLIGAAILIAIMITTMLAGVKLLKLYKEYPEEMATAAILIAVCLYQLILTFKQGNFVTSATPFWWFLILAKVYHRSLQEARLYSAWEAQVYQYEHPDPYEHRELQGA